MYVTIARMEKKCISVETNRVILEYQIMSYNTGEYSENRKARYYEVLNDISYSAMHENI
jgi:hypothetical protein